MTPRRLDWRLLDAARDLGGGVVDMRHELHRWPELGLHTPRTREAVLASLEGLPLDVTLHRTTSGVAALLTGARPGPTVLLRGDMDALPLHEDTGEACASRNDGVMHACGHDGHTAMLVGAARLLSGMRDQLAGRVLFMFQPGEENGAAGARHMLDEGLLDLPPHAVDGSASTVDAAYAIHLSPNAPTGLVITRPGPLMASSDRLTITVTGRGGHASQPHGAAVLFRAMAYMPGCGMMARGAARDAARWRQAWIRVAAASSSLAHHQGSAPPPRTRLPPPVRG